MTALDLDDAFERFMRVANPAIVAHSIQYRESRRVFYAGAAVVFLHFTKAAVLLSEDDGLRELESIKNQLAEFNKRVREERD